MIELKNLSCGYGHKAILSNINLSIKEGELTCILGKNGTGKTTFFKTILGLLPSLEGEILYHGQRLSEYSSKEVACLISYVPQAHGSPFPFSVLDVVLMGQYIHTSGFRGKPQKKNVDRAIECIESLGIEGLMHKKFSKISGGEKQMTLIARAMAQEPRFIAMDEPTANLDLGNSTKVMKVAELLTKKGYGVIMNTHLPEQALQFADSVIMLKSGAVLNTGKPQNILQANTLSDLYNTPIELVEAFTSQGESRQVLVTL